jgi:hypothetical protein
MCWRHRLLIENLMTWNHFLRLLLIILLFSFHSIHTLCFMIFILIIRILESLIITYMIIPIVRHPFTRSGRFKILTFHHWLSYRLLFCCRPMFFTPSFHTLVVLNRPEILLILLWHNHGSNFRLIRGLFLFPLLLGLFTLGSLSNWVQVVLRDASGIHVKDILLIDWLRMSWLSIERGCSTLVARGGRLIVVGKGSGTLDIGGCRVWSEVLRLLKGRCF